MIIPDLRAAFLGLKFRKKPYSQTEVLFNFINPLNAELSLIFQLLALLGANPILNVSRKKINYIYLYAGYLYSN
jgi:hypothetical protein